MTTNTFQQAERMTLRHLAVANQGASQAMNIPAVPALQKKSVEDEESQLKSVAQLATPEEDELQMKSANVVSEVSQRKDNATPETNYTGMSDSLKTGIEYLSGFSMDDVKVHYNSGKPAQLNALAYAQGTDIHIAPGQERHLPHEAWHVVQQKQGRVRPTMQMKGGINVNDDKGLENEADVMGEKASNEKSFNGLLNQEKSGLTNIVQRTIWQYKEGKGWEVVELGTHGKYKTDDEADPQKDEFFNDVNKKRAMNIDMVRAGLVDQMLHAGSLNTIAELGGSWLSLSSELSEICETSQKETVKENGGLLMLGIVKLWKEGNEEKFVVEKDLVAGKAEAAGRFMVDFMDKNGQLSFIRKQSWFQDGSYVVHIDLNFYHNRPMSDSGELGMHKDTAGDNLFVNLIFNNTDETPATEWTQDRSIPEGDKKEVMERLMPQKMHDDIVKAKEQLGTEGINVGGKDAIEGGVMPPNAYLSWVDELIWHSTPSLANRPKYAMKQYVLDNWKLINEHSQNVYEAVLMLEEDSSTYIHRVWEWWQSNMESGKGKVFSLKVWDEIKLWLQTSGKGHRSQDFEKDINSFKWEEQKWSGRKGEETDTDERKLSEKSIVPTGVMRRPRSNSIAETLEKVKAAASKQPRRSFLRSWVRVGKKV
jgi:hypothetical protein